MRALSGIKAQDVLILLKILCWRGREWRSVDLARELRISPAEVSMALERARRVGFLDSQKRGVMKAPLLEFLLHGVKYVFPAEPGPLCRGIPTSHSAPPLSKTIVFDEDNQFVWAHDEGRVRGQAVVPLYPTAPDAARNDPALYEFLALLDALRVGRARERAAAAGEVKKRLKGAVFEEK